MNGLELKKQWLKEENMKFQGWDFSYLNNRWEDESLSWSYEDILKKYLKSEYKLLDLGTGGGEFLLSLNHPYENTSVTEAWEPNVKLCKERLEPLGITVRQVYNDDELPYEDSSFDIVINRHEAYSAREIRRVLRPNGIFITQQVGGRNNEILSYKLIKDFKPEFPKVNLENYAKELVENDFEIVYSNEYYPHLRFYDVGAIVYFAKIIEWEFPGFSVEKCFEQLCKCNEEILEEGYVESLEHRFVLVGRNIKSN